MTEAAGAVVCHAFSALGFERVVGWCAAGNAAPARVMEKIGMKKERSEPSAVRLSGGERVDRIWYSLREEEAAKRFREVFDL
jgi:RimJ/RimL family protein N-acetyltransferase